ncbi:hypothetical protein [Vibrio maerlii]|uniref:hypothetical protein n=1 Tax=Vibrio maerlii TaxID=2231648 RepID=UPI000E3DE334|nr:hypothetical protein [Vibrio maerlii]
MNPKKVANINYAITDTVFQSGSSPKDVYDPDALECKLAQIGDDAALQRIVKRHLPLLVHLARKTLPLVHKQFNLIDLIDVAQQTMCKAIDLYVIDDDAKFIDFAEQYIVSQLVQLVGQENTQIRLPNDVLERLRH